MAAFAQSIIFPMSGLSAFTERFNLFLYRQHIRKLSAAEIEMAQEWSLNLIRKEHPHFTEQQVERFYENLINVQVIAVDEWTRRMN